jgi:uncharacterized membrane protein
LAGATGAAPIPARYEASILGPVTYHAEVFDLNLHGAASGYFYNSATGHNQACRFDAGVLTPAPGLDWHSYGVAINDPGAMAGAAGVGAFLLDGGAVTFASSLGYDRLQFTGLDNSGVAVGWGEFGASPYRETVLYDHGVVTVLPITGGLGASAVDLSQAGHVAGAIFIAAGPTGPGRELSFLYQGGTTTVLDLLPGQHTRAAAVNDLGQVAGTVYSIDETPAGWLFQFNPFQYSAADGSARILTIPDCDDAGAPDINHDGLMTGYYHIAGGGGPMVWNGTEWADLNALIDPASGWVLDQATAINDAGQIAGMGRLNGEARPYLLTPAAVPEPAGVALIGLGLGLLVRRRRRQPARR